MQEIKKLLRFCFGRETIDIQVPSAVEVLNCSYVFPVAKLLQRLPGEQVPGSENFS